MKSKAFAAIFFASAMTLLVPRPASAAWGVSITYFQRELSPYGAWVSTATYGELWHPTVVAAGWAPYTDGEWVWTECGWTWVSYDPFGEDPFHYGTWVWVDSYGWCWDPGYVWGPAWVTWAYTDAYIGWAPLPPTFVIAASGYAGSPVTVAQTQYVFVPVNSFVGTNVSTVRVAPAQNATILGQARRVTRYSVSGGLVRATDPPASLIERATGRPLHRTTLAAHKLKAAPISAAGLNSGKRVSITAPKHDRALAAREIKPSGRGAARHAAAPIRGAPATARTSKSAAAHKEKERASAHTGSARAESSAKHVSRGPAPARSSSGVGREGKSSAHSVREEKRPATAAATPKTIHREAIQPAPAPRSAESKHQNPPAVRREERHAAASSAPPGRSMSAPPAPPGAQGRAEQPHPAPAPAVAARPQPQPPPQAQPKGEKKEKEK